MKWSRRRGFRLNLGLGELSKDPAGEEVAESGSEMGGGSIARVAFNTAGHFFGAICGGVSVAGGEFGLFG